MTIPGFSSAARYKSTDAKPPSWVAIYDMDSPDVALSEAYTALRNNASANEKSIISRLTLLNRRIYSHLATLESPQFNPNSPAKFMLTVAMQPTPENEAEFNRWYTEEHLGLLSKVPGFLRARRFKVVSHLELAGKADPSLAKTPPSYIAVYDWDRDSYTDTPEFASAISTPWSVRIRESIVEVDLKPFAFHKSFSR